jgi:hypothetical protein
MDTYIDYMFFIENINLNDNNKTNVLLLNDNKNIIYDILSKKYNRLNIYLTQDDNNDIPKNINQNIHVIKERDDYKIISKISNKKFDIILINNIFSYERFTLYIFNIYLLINLNGYLIINNYESFRVFDLKKIDKIIKNFIQIYKENIEVSNIDNIIIIRKKLKLYRHISNELDEILNFFNKLPTFHEPILLPKSEDKEIIFNIQYSDTEPNRLKKLGYTEEFDEYNKKIENIQEIFYQKIKNKSKTIDKRILLFNILDYNFIVKRIRFFSKYYFPPFLKDYYTKNKKNILNIINTFNTLFNHNKFFFWGYYNCFINLFNIYYNNLNKNELNILFDYKKIKKDLTYFKKFIKIKYNLKKINIDRLLTNNIIQNNMYDIIHINKDNFNIDILNIQEKGGSMVIYNKNILLTKVDNQLIQLLNYYYDKVYLFQLNSNYTFELKYDIYCINFKGIKITNIINNTKYLSNIISNKIDNRLENSIYNINNIELYLINNYIYKNKLINYIIKSRDKANIEKIESYIYHKEFNVFINFLSKYIFIL